MGWYKSVNPSPGMWGLQGCGPKIPSDTYGDPVSKVNKKASKWKLILKVVRKEAARAKVLWQETTGKLSKGVDTYLIQKKS